MFDVNRIRQDFPILEDDWMVAVFIGNNLDGALHLFLAGKPVIFFQILKRPVPGLLIRPEFERHGTSYAF